MSVAAVSNLSRMQGSNDRWTSVTGHSTLAGLAALRERLVSPEVSGCARPYADIRKFDQELSVKLLRMITSHTNMVCSGQVNGFVPEAIVHAKYQFVNWCSKRSNTSDGVLVGSAKHIKYEGQSHDFVSIFRFCFLILFEGCRTQNLILRLHQSV